MYFIAKYFQLHNLQLRSGQDHLLAVWREVVHKDTVRVIYLFQIAPNWTWE